MRTDTTLALILVPLALTANVAKSRLGSLKRDDTVVTDVQIDSISTNSVIEIASGIVSNAVSDLASTSAVEQIARSVVNTVWDPQLGVAWEARMHNGQLYYVAVTNRPPEAR